MNNCLSIFTRSDLNRIRKETLKKRLVWFTGEFMGEHEAVNSGCAKFLIFTVSSNMANDSFNLFVSFLKENAEHLIYYPILRRKVELYFVSVNSPWMRKFSLSLLANAVNSGYDQGEHCLYPMLLALLTCWHIQFSKIFAFLCSP